MRFAIIALLLLSACGGGVSSGEVPVGFGDTGTALALTFHDPTSVVVDDDLRGWPDLHLVMAHELFHVAGLGHNEGTTCFSHAIYWESDADLYGPCDEEIAQIVEVGDTFTVRVTDPDLIAPTEWGANLWNGVVGRAMFVVVH